MTEREFKRRLTVLLLAIVSCLSLFAFIYFFTNSKIDQKDEAVAKAKVITNAKEEAAKKRPHIKRPAEKVVTRRVEPNNYGSILVLDLNNNGIVTTPLVDSKVFFDLDNDDFKEKVAWINDGDAMLFLDLNGNKKVDNARELFGYKDEKGKQISSFKNLLDNHDGNQDKIINADDAVFESLMLWQDINRDGRSQKDEINPLLTYKISRIDLSEIENLNEDILDNILVSTASYTINEDGEDQEYKIADVSLHINQMNAFYPTKKTKRRSISFDDIDEILREEEKSFLPRSRGYGTLKPWRVAFAEDEKLVLKEKEISNLKPANFVNKDGSNNVDIKVEEFMHQWAGTSHITGKRGFFDAKRLATLEALVGRGFVDNNGSTNLSKRQAKIMQKSWGHFFFAFKRRLLIQGLFRSEFKPAFYWKTKDTINFARLSKNKILSRVVEKYQGYDAVSNESAINYLKEIINILQTYTIGKIRGLKDKETLKSEFLKRMGIYIDSEAKSVFYDAEKIKNIHFLRGYKYYTIHDNRDVSYCVKNQSKIKDFVLEKFPKGCKVFGWLDFDKKSN